MQSTCRLGEIWRVTNYSFNPGKDLIITHKVQFYTNAAVVRKYACVDQRNKMLGGLFKNYLKGYFSSMNS